MTAAKLDLTVDQGATFSTGLTWYLAGPVVDGVVTKGAPVDLTGVSARMQIRTGYGQPVLVSLLSDTPGEIGLGGVNGTIQIVIPAVKTDLLTVKKAYYDLEVVRGDAVVRVLAGQVLVNPNITRDVS